MNILHIAKYYSPERGGIESVVKALAEGSAAAGHSVRVVCSNSKNVNVTESINGVQVCRLKTLFKLRSQPISLGVKKTLVEQIEWADIIHLHMPNPLFEHSLLKCRPTKPIIATYHSDIIRQKFLKNFYIPIQKRILRLVKHIVVSNRKVKKSFSGISDFTHKTKVIPFGVDTQNFFPVEDHEDYVCYVGRLVSYKGLENLIRACCKVSAPLKIAGVGPLQEKLVNLVEQLNAKDLVEFLGDIDDSQKSKLIARSRLCVLSSISRAESFGIFLIEAMACGVPVISTELGTGTDFVNLNYKTGFVVSPNNVQELAKAIEQLRSNSLIRNLFAKAARARAEEFFDQGQMLMEHFKLYGLPQTDKHKFSVQERQAKSEQELELL